MKDFIIGLIAVVALGVSFMSYTKEVSAPVAPVPVVQEEKESTGALSGPDISSPSLNINGVKFEYRSQAFAKATTTVCSFKTPAATSTLVSGYVSYATSTDTILTVAKATSRQATTTLIRSETVTADGIVAFPTSSTTVSAVVDQNRTFAPNTFLNVGIAGLSNVASSTLSGYCQAAFIVGT